MSSSRQENSLETLLRIYEHILDRMNEGVHVIDATGTTIVYNQKMTELESMARQDVLHKPLSEVFQFHSGQESTLLTCLRTGNSIRNTRQTYFNDKQKEITTINNTYPIIENGQIIGAMEIANDVTKMERLIRENLLAKNGSRYTFDQIIGKSGAILDVIENAKRAARTSSSVLVVGETGAGKELFVQSIHNASLRSSGPLISQNCAALPDSLIEGLLFGTARGAFTGAVERPGLFEQAEGGTLFLDEINSLSMPLQAKLLRALQEKSIRRIGDTKDRAIDVRIIAAINEDPVEAIANSHLRKDLYYRLGVVTLFLPPLRERKEDIPMLVSHFIEKYNELFQMEVTGVASDVLQFFQEHDWPGNVRELQHLIEGAMNLMVDETTIRYEHLPLHFLRRSPASATASEQASPRSLPFIEEGKSLKETMQEFETAYIHHVVDRYNGNISRAAKELHISRQSLQYRLRKLGIRG
ncbi:sigma 54-interacting transcriptional regulator [Brevibacillus agri]|uniref:PAS domain-containing protein n=2 Tax=Brevibacillus TaxID=55080 RepID=A0A3M8APN1_9BACL|nr:MULTISPECIES: sigma 54-interacting transcriptional regulator [Brevibacillus]QHZ57123.1 PAS domain-containing protein [Brevibacillus sp. NSP2.1]MDN4091835.1 sigma 54-interacting transcriptional regulator [Brevibacillus agri]MED1643155.1 sigma 54-interacting transcriptional regulator [Brevibacillus agri]MED1656057.1 sigma 54-interacting transcriptional regulator [Brevibacillus agri]MED1686192.1 sigma 54-interacting transcriptional regulator [Brevibacillus agri]